MSQGVAGTQQGLWVASLGLVLLLSLVWWSWWASSRPNSVDVGLVTWVTSAAIVGSSEIHAAELFMDDHPDGPIRVIPVDDQWMPERTTQAIEEAMAEGMHYFIATHPSNCAEASLHLFADGRALMLNAASTSPLLSGRDDFFLRLTPDAHHEQRAIAREVARWPGRRLLVFQDTGNRAYTDPAFATFVSELTALSDWDIVHRPLQVSDFRPDEDRPLMAEPFDALYILAGSYLPAIGNIAQLFYVNHPEAPILLTPWARSPAILDTAGPAITRLILPSQHPSRKDDPLLDAYFQRLSARFGYQPHDMTINTRRALELLNQAFAAGHDTPATVKHYLLSQGPHATSLGPVLFDEFGDLEALPFVFLTDLARELR